MLLRDAWMQIGVQFFKPRVPLFRRFRQVRDDAALIQDKTVLRENAEEALELRHALVQVFQVVETDLQNFGVFERVNCVKGGRFVVKTERINRPPIFGREQQNVFFAVRVRVVNAQTTRSDERHRPAYITRKQQNAFFPQRFAPEQRQYEIGFGLI